ncbi:hypothetical protein BN1232_02930 [Mycobacterium lentiflavum]|uniref:Uncharacterized protein n=1 Tax=Mycobacterium lentiflavum TaxID=141349 RepID=A0A0E4CNG0_MYCLN|nr:hypothetical protein BN1232_02930 [Mycobacterium lentiflavum]
MTIAYQFGAVDGRAALIRAQTASPEADPP